MRKVIVQTSQSFEFSWVVRELEKHGLDVYEEDEVAGILVGFLPEENFDTVEDLDYVEILRYSKGVQAQDGH